MVKNETTQHTLDALHRRIACCTATIVYIPRLSEIEYLGATFPLRLPLKQIQLPYDAKSNPFSWAQYCTEMCENNDVCILIPGTRFDEQGTRYGRGGGWYDRFLSGVPCKWVRIGITDASHFSSTTLTKHEWDQPVDWIIVDEHFSWNVYKALDRSNNISFESVGTI